MRLYQLFLLVLMVPASFAYYATIEGPNHPMSPEAKLVRSLNNLSACIKRNAIKGTINLELCQGQLKIASENGATEELIIDSIKNELSDP